MGSCVVSDIRIQEKEESLENRRKDLYRSGEFCLCRHNTSLNIDLFWILGKTRIIT